MSKTEYSRLLLKRSTFPGVTPTIPTGTTISNSWLPTDLIEGELFLNSADDRLWIRTANGIQEIAVSGFSSANYYTINAYTSGTTIWFNRNDLANAYSVDVASILSAYTAQDKYTTGSTLIGTTLVFDRNDMLSAYTADLSSLAVDLNTFVTGFTYDNANTLTISNNNGTDYSATINTMTGLTINGNLTVTGTTSLNILTANTIGTSGSCVTDLYVDNLYGCSPITVWDSIQSNGSQATGTTSFAFGNSNIAGDYSHAEGSGTRSYGFGSHSEGNGTIASGTTSHAEGSSTRANGTSSHAEGSSTTSIGVGSHAEGQLTISIGNYSHAEGDRSTSIGTHSHAEGDRTTATGYTSHSEGQQTTSIGQASHAEGVSTKSIGFGSHTEGSFTTAIGNNSHAEGSSTIAIGIQSHAEGQVTTTYGQGSHAEGQYTTTYGNWSHAEGQYTIANADYQHVSGLWNVTGDTQGAFIVGNGTDASNRRNLLFVGGTGSTGTVNVSGKTITTDLQVTNGANSGYVLTSDSNGNATWTSQSSLTGVTNTYVTGGTLTGTDLTLNYNTGGSASPIDLSSLEFTGNTSGNCISDIYVSNIHSCSPLNINPNDEGNVYFGSNSGITIDVVNDRLGIGTSSPEYTLDIIGTNSRVYYDPTSVGGRFLLSGNTNVPRYDAIISGFGTRIGAGGSWGMRTWDDSSYPGYGKVGDMFLYAGNETYGLNFINPVGTNQVTRPTEDYIRFYAGQLATGTADIHIQGSGSTRGFVGIGTETPTDRLTVNGKTKTTNLQVTNGATNGYVLTSDSLGNATWTSQSSLTGVTQTLAQTLSNGNTTSGNNIVITSGDTISGDTNITLLVNDGTYESQINMSPLITQITNNNFVSSLEINDNTTGAGSSILFAQDTNTGITSRVELNPEINKTSIDVSNGSDSSKINVNYTEITTYSYDSTNAYSSEIYQSPIQFTLKTNDNVNNVTQIDLNNNLDGTGAITISTIDDVNFVQDQLILDPSNGGIGTQLISLGTSTSHYSNITLTPSQVQIKSDDLVNTRNITIIPSAITINGGVAEYDADYSLNYTNRSIIDKEYVDNAVAGAGGTFTGGTVTGATNFTAPLSAQTLTLDTTYTGTTGVGTISWNTEFGVPQVGMIGGNVVGKIGEAVYAYVKNVDTTTLNKGEVVYIFGASGDKISVKRASSSGDTTSSKTLGVVAESITVNGLGYVITQGTLDGLNLGSYTAGDILWLGDTPGTFTNVKSYAPNHLVFVGVVQRANNGNGQMYVKPQNGYELEELHNVATTGATNGDLLIYSGGSTNLWVNSKTLTGNYTVNGGLNVTGTTTSGTISATTISATTYNGDGKNLLGVGGGRGSFGITIDGGGSAITTGQKGYVTIPYDGTITGWDIFADTTGSTVIDVWKDTYANFPPTVADSIAGTEKPTLSSAVKNQDTNLTSWTTSVSAGDIIAFNVDSAATVTRVNLIIYITKS